MDIVVEKTDSKDWWSDFFYQQQRCRKKLFKFTTSKLVGTQITALKMQLGCNP